MIGVENYKEGILIKIYVQPNASRTQFVGVHGEAIKLKINEPPVEGAANKGCLKFLSKFFSISKSKIVLISGEKSRNKEFYFEGLSKDKVLEIMKNNGVM